MKPRFDYIAGTGGVGRGILFLLDGEEALGKNESRLAELTDFQDFCKLHIILHYTAKLLRRSIPVYPISRVGDDENGRELKRLMMDAGMDIHYLTGDSAKKTMFAVCFQYPSGEGGNITTSNSACSNVCESDIDRFFESRRPDERGMLLAAPEVPLGARLHLLKKGRRYGCYNAASLLSSEAGEFVGSGYFSGIDLLSINQDEARAILNAAGMAYDEENLAISCGNYLNSRYPHMAVIITLGRRGSQSFVKGNAQLIPPVGGKPVSTAGAGDCFLGVVLACIALGIPLQGAAGADAVDCAVRLASVAAGLKVTSRDTIHFGIDVGSIASFAKQSGLSTVQEIEAILQI